MPGRVLVAELEIAVRESSLPSGLRISSDFDTHSFRGTASLNPAEADFQVCLLACGFPPIPHPIPSGKRRHGIPPKPISNSARNPPCPSAPTKPAQPRLRSPFFRSRFASVLVLQYKPPLLLAGTGSPPGGM